MLTVKPCTGVQVVHQHMQHIALHQSAYVGMITCVHAVSSLRCQAHLCSRTPWLCILANCPITRLCWVQRILFVKTALLTKKIVLTSICPYSEGPLQSECSDWSPIALSLHSDSPCIEGPYKESLLYQHVQDAAWQQALKRHSVWSRWLPHS